MIHVLAIHVSANDLRRDDVIDFDGKQVRLTQVSTDFDYNLAKDLIVKYDGLVDAISLSGIPPAMKSGQKIFSHPDRERLLLAAEETPVLDGLVLKEIYMPWLLRKFFVNNPEWIKNKKVGFYSGLLMQQTLEVIEDFTEELVLADLYFLAKVPWLLNSTKEMRSVLEKSWPLMKMRSVRKKSLGSFDGQILGRYQMRDFLSAQVVVSNMATLELIDLSHLRGKKLILDVCNQKILDLLKMNGVEEVLILLPQMIDGIFVNFSILEGLLQASQNLHKSLTVDFVLSHMKSLKISPIVVSLKETKTFETQFLYL
ncbi:MAG: hypothetical protein Fur0010_20660 [Bdellovibrio sp.]